MPNRQDQRTTAFDGGDNVHSERVVGCTNIIVLPNFQGRGCRLIVRADLSVVQHFQYPRKLLVQGIQIQSQRGSVECNIERLRRHCRRQESAIRSCHGNLQICPHAKPATAERRLPIQWRGGNRDSRWRRWGLQVDLPIEATAIECRGRECYPAQEPRPVISDIGVSRVAHLELQGVSKGVVPELSLELPDWQNGTARSSCQQTAGGLARHLTVAYRAGHSGAILCRKAPRRDDANLEWAHALPPRRRLASRTTRQIRSGQCREGESLVHSG
mmetsp:Transcript_172848/g.554149  ORF Transcript_172848/g.554149 Transcript_172848/m.554149 type:complete len:272 (-) Transcript_172848:71-886(-)